MEFVLVGPILAAETIARGRGIQNLARLCRTYGNGRWRKRKGVARVRLVSGELALAEVHWYEAHGIGKVGMKIKRLIEVTS